MGDAYQDMRLFLLYTWWDLGWGVWKFDFIEAIMSGIDRGA